MIRLLIFSLVMSSALANAQSDQPIVRSISIFRNEIQLDIKRSPRVRVGSKLSAKLPVPHNCLLVVTRVVNRVAYADATQCPGYATLKKGQPVEVSVSPGVNKEVQQNSTEGNEQT